MWAGTERCDEGVPVGPSAASTADEVDEPKEDRPRQLPQRDDGQQVGRYRGWRPTHRPMYRTEMP
jgi:hypothetical protein